MSEVKRFGNLLQGCRSAILRFVVLFGIFCAWSTMTVAQPTSEGRRPVGRTYTIDNCVNEFTPAHIESTKAGYQYWFVDRTFADGKTLKLSVVRPHDATHAPHRHGEDEFFFILEGKAEVYLEGKARVVGPYASFYCPPSTEHGIRNVGDADLKYLVVKQYRDQIDLSTFWDSEHHWYDIHDEAQVIEPLPGRPQYGESQIAAIAENVILFQKANGGWPKNYDMRAILTDDQRSAIHAAKNTLNTTFDNGATHSHVQFLAQVYATEKDPRFKEACLRGLDFIMEAQYSNGGWPQFYPDTSGYRKYITFNDGAMIGVMNVLHQVATEKPWFAFVDGDRRKKIRQAFERGIQCILNCQIQEKGVLEAWGQQHDNIDLRPRRARTFEPAALCSQESAEIVLFLMSLNNPSSQVVASVKGAVQWFSRAAIHGIVVRTIDAPPAAYQYHSTTVDRVVQQDSSAAPIWARFYELGTGRPLFSNRDGVPVYSLDDVDRERRTGYAWYNYAPDQVLRNYPAWEKKHGR